MVFASPGRCLVVLQNVDRWGNVVSITDPRSTAWKTTYRYNADNQVVEQVQTTSDGVEGLNPDGSYKADAPVTRIYYDPLGRQVAVRDANGHVNGQVWDAGGNLVRQLQAPIAPTSRRRVLSQPPGDVLGRRGNQPTHGARRILASLMILA